MKSDLVTVPFTPERPVNPHVAELHVPNLKASATFTHFRH